MLFDVDVAVAVAVAVVALIIIVVVTAAEANKALAVLTKELRKVAPLQTEDTPSYRAVRKKRVSLRHGSGGGRAEERTYLYRCREETPIVEGAARGCCMRTTITRVAPGESGRATSTDDCRSATANTPERRKACKASNQYCW